MYLYIYMNTTVYFGKLKAGQIAWWAVPPDLSEKRRCWHVCLKFQALSEGDVLERFPWTGAGMRDSEKKHGSEMPVAEASMLHSG